MSKLNNLVEWFADKNKVMIALSGGVDSAVVAYAAFQALGSSAIAVTADYKTLSQEELQSAKQVCSEIGIEQMILDYSELENEEFAKNLHLLKKLGEPEDIANAVLFLASSKSDYINGETLHVNGGMYMA